MPMNKKSAVDFADFLTYIKIEFERIRHFGKCTDDKG